MQKICAAILALLTVAVVVVWVWKKGPDMKIDKKQPADTTQQLVGEVQKPAEESGKQPEVPAEPEKPAEPAEPEKPVEQETPAVPETPAEPEKPTEPDAPAEPATPADPAGSAFDTTAWNLLLVNPWNALPDNYEKTLVNINLSTSMQTSSSMKADSRVYDALVEMLMGCKAAGLAPVVCSAYRSYDTQVYLFNNKISRLKNEGYDAVSARQEAARVVAVPGTSEHQTGMAFDIVAYSYQALEEDQENTAEQKWLMEHCYEYGFILRYPKEKEDITGIIYEPWHYRYVGKEAALAIRDSGLCLEEWLGKADEATLPRLPF